jgi:glucosylceramidase
MMRRAALVLALLPAGARVHAQTVDVWVTTADRSRLLAQQPVVAFTPEGSVDGPMVRVDDRITYQPVAGFGASLTDSSAWLIWAKLSEAQREALLRSLFDPNTGIGLSFLRQPMGASDFSVNGHYSYDDVPAGEMDLSLDHFSIARDLKYMIPELLQIKSINPSVKIMATPWSPPAWMKTSGSLIGGTLRREAYDAWADYFVKFVKAYAAHGLAVDYVTLQNEPLNVPPDYPGMGMDAETQKRLLSEHLAPAFAKASMAPGILGWDHNWTNSFPYDVLKDQVAQAYVQGTAWHCYGGSVESQGDLHKLFPEKENWETECSGFTGSSFAKDLRYDVQTLLIGVMRNWGRGALRWNLALDENHGPHTGGCANCTAFVTIDSRTGAVTRNVDYYGFGHASRFVVPGALRVSSDSFPGDIENVAFVNPDGTRVVIAFNAGKRSRRFGIAWHERMLLYELPAGAAATFIWTGDPLSERLPNPVTMAAVEPSPLPVTAVSASSTERPGMEPARAVDGNAFTRWSSAFSDPQWIAVDFGAMANIDRVRLNWEGACGKEYDVQVSNDGEHWRTVRHVKHGHAGLSDHLLSARARYVRIYGTARITKYGYSLWELEVFGALSSDALARAEKSPPPS